MVKYFVYLLLAGLTVAAAGQVPVEKTNPMKVFMHYMPWFETPETIGRWGWHWTMNTCDPDVVGNDGQREIASHFYPLIGPYASRDRYVIEYHFLLMKYSGIDGILIDWYGTEGSNGDIKDLLKSSDSIVSYTDDFGMPFGVVLEDRFSRSANDVKANLAYLMNYYFVRDEYIRLGENRQPLVCIFGPVTFEDPADWADILPAAGEEIEFLPLWYESGEAGSLADGEFSWVYQDQQDHLTHLENFYKNRAASLKIAMGSAYPGFLDFYEEGGAGSGYFIIPHDNGSTLAATLERAGRYDDRIDMLLLVTFNDLGEGTMFEPTVETGFGYLEQVQAFTGVVYGEAELKLVYRLYELRREYIDDWETQLLLDQVSIHLRNLETEQAFEIMESIKPTSLPPQEDPGGGRSQILLFPNPVEEGNLYIRSGLSAGKREILISDVNGKVLLREELLPGQELISIGKLNLPPGVFLLTLTDEHGSASGRFIVTE